VHKKLTASGNQEKYQKSVNPNIMIRDLVIYKNIRYNEGNNQKVSLQMKSSFYGYKMEFYVINNSNVHF